MQGPSDLKRSDASSNKERESNHVLESPINELAELTVVAEGEERTTFFVWLLVLCCGISGLLFGEELSNQFLDCIDKFCVGYDTGVISGALVTIGSDLGPAELSNLQKVRSSLCLLA